MKIVVYTANLGGYDKQQDWIEDDGVQYIRFTDEDVKKYKELEGLSPRRQSRYFKMLPHAVLPNHDVSIWVDSCLKLINPLSKLVESLDLDASSLFIPEHPNDGNVWEQFQTIEKYGLEEPEMLQKTYKALRVSGHNLDDVKLTENCIIIRTQATDAIMFNELWWMYYNRLSQRDQLTSPLAMQASNVRLQYLDFHSRTNTWYTNWGNHLKSRKVV